MQQPIPDWKYKFHFFSIKVLETNFNPLPRCSGARPDTCFVKASFTASSSVLSSSTLDKDARIPRP